MVFRTVGVFFVVAREQVRMFYLLLLLLSARKTYNTLLLDMFEFCFMFCFCINK